MKLRWFPRKSIVRDGETIYFIRLPTQWVVVVGGELGVWATWNGDPAKES